MTDNGIGDEGAKALSEMLKVNKTLTDLEAGSLDEREIKQREKKNELQVMELELEEQKH